jgi:hypothetical protein
MKKIPTFSEIASAFSLYGNGVVCGPGLTSQQITVYSQQVRALNLAFLMHEGAKRKKRKPLRLRIAVVGAGATGLTFSAAMLSLGHKVTMFERQSDKMYLQKGCYTRFLHPNSYYWPELGSYAAFADLPILSWRAANAANVSRQILDKFDQIVQLCGGAFSFHSRSFIKVDAQNISIDWQSVDSVPRRGSQSRKGPERNHAGSDKFHRIVLCIGYGLEDEVDDEKHFSYWRNDSLNQIRATSYAASRTDYWVSGSGDGALIDVQRLKIQDYDQSRFVHDVWEKGSDPVSNQELLAFFSETNGRVDKDSPTGLYDAIDALKSQRAVKKLDEFLQSKRRTDTFIILNSKSPSFQKTLGAREQSFLNALVCHRLYNQGAFVYLGGEMKLIDGEWTHALRTKHHMDAHLIIRHGARSLEMLDNCWDNWNKLSTFEAMKDSNKASDFSRRLWPVGWWNGHVIDRVHGKLFPGKKSDRIEYFSPDIGILFESLMIALAVALTTNSTKVKLFRGAPSYRLCVNRLIKIQNSGFYQQITNYFGTRTDGRAGRVFELESGVVGLACALSQAVFMRVPSASHPGDRSNCRDLWHALRGKNRKINFGKLPDVGRLYIAFPLTLQESGAESKIAFAIYIELDSDVPLTPELLKQLQQLVNEAFQPFQDGLAEYVKSKRAFFADMELPTSNWVSEAPKLVREYGRLLKASPIALKLPKGVTSEATFNRYQEAGDEP